MLAVMSNALLGASPWAVLPEALAPFLQASTQLAQAGEGHAFASPQVSPLQPAGSGQREVAVLPMRGVILPYTSLFALMLGATCLDTLSADFCAARDNPAIKTIVLAIDSPGGMVTGVQAFSAQVFAARSIKPIIAIVSGLAASAAYWIAAAATEVRVDPTASVGSIGVIMTVQNKEARDKKTGITTTEIISSQSPHKRPDILTDTGRSQWQQHVDALAEVFVCAVATYRNVSTDTVLSHFGQGGLVVGSAAVKQGLADALYPSSGLPHAVFHHLKGASSMSTHPSQITLLQAPCSESSGEKAIHVPIQAMGDKQSAEQTMLFEQAFAAGVEKGKVLEAERIAGLEAQSLPGHEALIARLKADRVSTGSDAAVHILAAERIQREERAEARRRDTPEPLSPLALDLSAGPLPLEAQCEKEWAHSAALRAEFFDLEGYKAYRKADTQGLIKYGPQRQEKNLC
jgi:signal peptide peptidase SppA